MESKKKKRYKWTYLQNRNRLRNTTTIGKIDIGVKEEIKQWKEDVGISIPKGTADCWVRVYISDPTTLDGKKIYSRTKVDNFDENWTLDQEDGYYYYNKVVPYSEEEQILSMFKEIRMNEELAKQENASMKEGNYNVIIYGETVQDNGEKNAKEAFAKLKK